MRLALISPPQPYLITQHTQVPLGLLYLSAVVKRDCPGWEVEVLDYSAGAPDVFDEFDVYGFTATSLDFPAALALKERIAEQYPGSTYIIGGPHVTALPGDGLDFDAVFVGEGENCLMDYLNAGGRGEGEYCDWGLDIGALPYPDREALDWVGGQVLTREHGRSVNIMASRGCPYRCAFCASEVMWGSGVRWRTPEDVVAEIVECRNSYGVDVFRFSDDNMTSNREWTTEFCRLVKPLKIRWRLSCRVDRLDWALLAIMSEAGCEEMGLGVESFDQAVLDVLNKQQTVEQAIEAVEMVHAAGIGPRILMMVNTPGETPATIDKNIAALEALRGKFAYVSVKVFMPLPGTRIWKNPDRYGILIVNRDYGRYNFFVYQRDKERSVWSPICIDGMTCDEQSENAVRMVEYLETLPEAAKGNL